MKKLLLLAVLALGVVACEKNDLGMDMDGSSINAPIEAKIVKDLSNLDRTLDLVLSKTYEKSNSSITAKEAVVGSFVRIASTDLGDSTFEFLFGDDINECDDSAISFYNIYLVLDSNLHTEVRLETIDGTLHKTISRDLTALFKLDDLAEGLEFPYDLSGYRYSDYVDSGFEFTGEVYSF